MANIWFLLWKMYSQVFFLLYMLMIIIIVGMVISAVFYYHRLDMLNYENHGNLNRFDIYAYFTIQSI